MVLLKEADEIIIEDIRKDVELIKECITAPWIYVHIAAVFESNISVPQTSSDICGIDHVFFFLFLAVFPRCLNHFYPLLAQYHQRMIHAGKIFLSAYLTVGILCIP